jgi:hypothetical protein
MLCCLTDISLHFAPTQRTFSLLPSSHPTPLCARAWLKTSACKVTRERGIGLPAAQTLTNAEGLPELRRLLCRQVDTTATIKTEVPQSPPCRLIFGAFARRQKASDARLSPHVRHATSAVFRAITFWQRRALRQPLCPLLSVPCRHSFPRCRQLAWFCYR